MPESIKRFKASLGTLLNTNKTILTIVIVLFTVIGMAIAILTLPGKITAKVLPIRILGIVGGMLLAFLGTAIVALGIWKGASILSILMGGALWLVGGYIWTHYESRKLRSRSFFFMSRESPWKELNILGGHFLVFYGLAFIALWVTRNDIWDLAEGLIAIVIGGAIIDYLGYKPKPPSPNKKGEYSRTNAGTI